jgi:hypothetical protein
MLTFQEFGRKLQFIEGNGLFLVSIEIVLFSIMALESHPKSILPSKSGLDGADLET